MLGVAPMLRRLGGELVEVGVDRDGRVRSEEFRDAIDERTALASLMAGNNEVAPLQPVQSLGAIARSSLDFSHAIGQRCLSQRLRAF